MLKNTQPEVRIPDEAASHNTYIGYPQCDKSDRPAIPPLETKFLPKPSGFGQNKVGNCVVLLSALDCQLRPEHGVCME